MDFYEKLKIFLFGSRHKDNRAIFNNERPTKTPLNQPEIENDGDNKLLFGNHQKYNYDVSDPLEIPRLFEELSNEMLKPFRSNFGPPSLEDYPLDDYEKFCLEVFGPKDEEVPPADNLREHYLKESCKDPIKESTANDKIDEDIDAQVNKKNFGSVFDKNHFGFSTSSLHIPRFFGQSTTTRSFTNSQGSSEVHSMVTDNDGNEETTITRRLGDKEYTIIKRIDKNGKEEITEKFINMNKEEVDKYFPDTLFHKLLKWGGYSKK